MSPAVSVITPVWNAAATLAETVASVRPISRRISATTTRRCWASGLPRRGGAAGIACIAGTLAAGAGPAGFAFSGGQE